METLPDLDKLASLPESQRKSFLLVSTPRAAPPSPLPNSHHVNAKNQGNTLTQLIFGFTVFFLKFSALALFRELFWGAGSRAARTVLNALTYLTVVCATAAVTGSLYTSFPAYSLDNASGDDHYKLKVNGRFNFVATVVLDFAIFLVPIWQLWRVRIDSRKKRDIILAFCLGFL
ncbi:hypothetical protein PG985_011930 [Apiospora marii]|uniref:uncharacterized protein n=1 Tax=Apiospora marii TaxID=335849 RepID=UPI00312EB183